MTLRGSSRVEQVRAKVVLVLELSLTAIAQLTLLALYNPASYNTAFPFHATTALMNGPSGPQRVVVKVCPRLSP